jgi:hypothetical protein
MTKTMQRFADGLLSRLVPQVEVSAACTYTVTCSCVPGGRRIRKTCYDCPGVPKHCTPCNKVDICPV